MASLEDLEAQAAKAADNSTDEFEEGNSDAPDQVHVDVKTALDLLERTNNLLGFLADLDMHHTITKRERNTIARWSKVLDDFIKEVGPEYEDIELIDEEE